MRSHRYSFAALFLALSAVAPAMAAPAMAATATPSSIPFLGAVTRDKAVEKELADDFRKISSRELDALMEIIHICELNRAHLRRRDVYDAWKKRCTKVEDIWTAKYRHTRGDRMIDVQMRLYAQNREAFAKAVPAYFARKETIARKLERQEDVSKDVAQVIKMQRALFAKSTHILKFFFALIDLFKDARS